MSDAADGRSLAAGDFDDDEIEWGDEPGEEESGDDSNLSPIEQLVTEGDDIFDGPDDEDEPDDEDD